MLPNNDRVEISPPAVLRCDMAEAVADWVRDDLAGLVVHNLGSRLRSVRNYAAYHCRSRNNIVGGVASEHGKGNALDVGSITLVNGKTIDPTDLKVSRDFREGWKKSVCDRFSTVLGPGSDGYHENHVHLDLKERQNGYRICQWEIRVPDESLQLQSQAMFHCHDPDPSTAGQAAEIRLLSYPVMQHRSVRAGAQFCTSDLLAGAAVCGYPR